MNRHCRGFGLIELMIALVLSLIVVLGVVQIFIAAKNTYVSQNAAAVIQEDARFALSKMVQEIRMVGMFGCVATIIDASTDNSFAASQTTPIRWDNANRRLTLVTADIGSGGSAPTWTVVSDCRTSATAYSNARVPATGQLAFPIRRLVYSFNNNQLLLGSGTANPPTLSVLVDNVRAFDVTFGVAASDEVDAAVSYSSNPSSSEIRSVRLTLTLFDPKNTVHDQTFNVVAALRNRLR
ncbi:MULTISPECIES: PilW family protein [unclassified Pseudomonas]|uniref:PilW family protein n=1 Tax=unclassified Pseudomonas TaxID=196821 RepID=UPI000876B1EA|nr:MULTISPECIES: prepilin-type N-terminal cleavage/methylation domain-containing protein [unclassified Pseudomonas]SCZ46722.1 type IV pilus assembly protein PilW [Pseudomonas sp. NFACC44-2]SDA90222.1 type IV pilus assembly protein PilW [Pseudomonas sp. NFACC51]SEJ97853.1 type IV pilus assembly protein PilW [Pseudomonas sp. NFACC07-1]SFJ29404.1 type IV pilus assembly protein PilW [Pseudomonas sp. NFACC54]SFT28857.1 type IV pilus assembly protein PilW [Pseudomonas sp. NFACC48-1]